MKAVPTPMAAVRLVQDIIAIEPYVNERLLEPIVVRHLAKAAEQERAAIRAAVQDMPRADGDSHWFEVDQRAVLAVLDRRSR